MKISKTLSTSIRSQKKVEALTYKSDVKVGDCWANAAVLSSFF
jgi:hypothetical protein